ncbi:MAG TPA: hypothetical protein PLV25_07090, partial [Opitutales bacterium]|nr:hypothetical protein [Opitutales bacterium]
TPVQIAGYSLCGLVAIALITGAVFAYLAYRKRKALGPPLTPLQIAQRDLQLLKNCPPATDALWGQSMSEILRTFLEKVHRIQAIESTTEELRAYITALPDPMAQNLMQVLERCDVARFAARSLGDDAKAELISLAQEGVRPQLDEANPPATAAQPNNAHA